MKLLAAATSILLTFFTTVGLAQAQGYPVRTVRIVVPYPSGSGPDMFARVLAQQLQESLGRPFVIDNKAGAVKIYARLTDNILIKQPRDEPLSKSLIFM